MESYNDYQGVATAIRDMTVRGAPAIGAAAAFGLALAGFQSRARTPDELDPMTLRKQSSVSERIQTDCGKLELGAQPNYDQRTELLPVPRTN